MALVLFLVSIEKCALLGDYWNSVKEHCEEEEECMLDLADGGDFDPLGLRQKECMVKEVARRTVTKFSAVSPSRREKLRRLADPDASPSKRLRVVEREFERPAAILIFLYVLELLASNTCVLRETSLIFDALSTLSGEAGLEGDLQLLVEKGLRTVLETGGNLKDMLHSFPLLEHKVDAIAQMGQGMDHDVTDHAGDFLKERLTDKFRFLEVDSGASGAA
jgi:hypothetical protein